MEQSLGTILDRATQAEARDEMRQSLNDAHEMEISLAEQVMANGPLATVERLRDFNHKLIKTAESKLQRAEAAARVNLDNLYDQKESFLVMMEAEMSQIRETADKRIDEIRASLNSHMLDLDAKAKQVENDLKNDRKALQRQIAASRSYLEAIAEDVSLKESSNG